MKPSDPFLAIHADPPIARDDPVSISAGLLRDSIPGLDTIVWEHRVRTGTELVLEAGSPSHFIAGELLDSGGQPVQGQPCLLVAWGPTGSRPPRPPGASTLIWAGNTTEVNASERARAKGHPLGFGGGPLNLWAGTRVVLIVSTPSGGRVVAAARSTFALHCRRVTRIHALKLIQ